MVAVKAFLISTLVALPFTGAATVHVARDGHDHTSRSALPDTWYHDDNHPAHLLFKRGPDDGTGFAPIGSPTWSAGFPKTTPDPNQLPKPWVDALTAAVNAGRIPNIPQTTSINVGVPQYPAGYNPNGPQVCSAYYKTCRNKADIWDAPDGYLGTSFDDGPLPDQVTLNNFLAQNNEKTTYFLIGVNMLANPQVLQDTINQGHDIAVHTWTHPQMTTLSNLDVLGQLGWTVELIRNSTGGKIPKYWRPPTGDSDERVRAIAMEVFGLTTVLWNHDTEDWSLTTGGTTAQYIHGNYTQWLAGPKHPGMIILEHVVSPGSVAAFIDAYPLIKASGWKTNSVIRLVGDGSAFSNSTSTTAGSSTAGSSTPSGTSQNQSGTSKSTTPTSSSNTPSASNNAATTTTAQIFGSASIVAFSYLLSFLL
jgi:chitin deacetylase